ncbi:MAG: glycosyltransferase family 2 protein [Nodosilinea sp.]
MLSFGVIVCTYNRRDILEQCLEAWSQANQRPDQFIVVDATAGAESYKNTLLSKFPKLFAQPESQYIVTKQPGLTRQRNLGLAAIKTDIVCFADDDTFVRPNYIEKILTVFERDTNGLIGGVNGVAVGQFDRWPQRNYRAFRNYIRHHFGSLIQRIHVPKQETQVFTPLPTEFKHLRLIYIDRLWGANMNFRTDLVRDLRFDESFSRYGLYEDVDMSVRVGKTHKLVCCLDAELEHDHSLGETTRPSDVKYFLTSWLNSAYVIEKLFSEEASRAAHRRYFRAISLVSKLMPKKFRNQKFRVFGNQELQDMAQSHMDRLQACMTSTDLEKTFVQLQEEIFGLGA